MAIAIHHDFEIYTLEIAEDHAHVFHSFPRRYFKDKILGMLKSISASAISRGQAKVKEQLWCGAFSEDGYFSRTVGDKVTAELIRKYIRYHGEQKNPPSR